MANAKRDVDLLPEEFASLEEAAEFWDTHDTADYPEAFSDEPIEMVASLQRRRFEVEVAEDLIEPLHQQARSAGISVRQLVSELLRRQLLPSPG